MDQTIIQKIIAAKCGRKEVEPGEMVWARPDLIAQYMAERSIPDVRIDPDRIAITLNHHFAPKGEIEARIQWTLRETARRYNIKNFDEIGRSGVQYQRLGEKGLIRPGMLVVHLDPHISTYGAFGAYCCGVANDYFQAFRTGEVWLKVPETVKINVTGKFGEGVTSRDLFEQILADLGPSGALGQAIQFTGQAVADMSLASRMVLCNSVVFLGAETAIIEADEKVLEYLRGRTDKVVETIRSDPGAVFANVLDYDVSGIEPLVVLPDAVYHIKPVLEAAGPKIDQAFIGTCASGRLEDLRLAARILKGRKVHPDVRMIITPITPEMQQSAAREGLTDIFWEAGAVVGPPSCGMCLQNAYGWVLPGERLISTGTLNLPGRQGSPEGETYLANPATVAASAIAGKITDPREYL